MTKAKTELRSFLFNLYIFITLTLNIFAKYAAVYSIYSLVPIAGAVAAITEGLHLGIPPAALISFIIFADAVPSLFLVWNYDYAKKIPGIGKFVEKVEKIGEKAMRKYKWVERFGFISIGVLSFI